jgi:transcriptional regulator with XRE-family HTH domain
MNMTLGSYLKQIREERGLGVREVSRLSKNQCIGGNLSPSLIVQIENGGIKSPGILKLVTLAEIYEVDLSILRSFLDEDKKRRISEHDVEKVTSVMHSIASTVKIFDELRPFGKLTQQGIDESKEKYSQLYVDLMDILEDVDMPLVYPADNQPPIPLSYAQRILNAETDDGKTRRQVLRLLLTLKEWDLKDAAAAFFAASPRSIRSAILLEPLDQMRLPIPKEGSESTKVKKRSRKKEG